MLLQITKELFLSAAELNFLRSISVKINSGGSDPEVVLSLFGGSEYRFIVTKDRDPQTVALDLSGKIHRFMSQYGKDPHEYGYHTELMDLKSRESKIFMYRDPDEKNPDPRNSDNLAGCSDSPMQ